MHKDKVEDGYTVVARSDVEASQVGGSMQPFALHARPYDPQSLSLCIDSIPRRASGLG